jgi:hypothetical protein
VQKPADLSTGTLGIVKIISKASLSSGYSGDAAEQERSDAQEANQVTAAAHQG